jgi:hypothetical protein
MKPSRYVVKLSITFFAIIRAVYSGPDCQDTEQTIYKLGAAPFWMSFLM